MKDLIGAGLSTREALARVGYPKSSWYRHQAAPRVRRDRIRQADRPQPHALAEAETAQILAWLSEERFADFSVQQTFWWSTRAAMWLHCAPGIGSRPGTGCVAIVVATPPIRPR